MTSFAINGLDTTAESLATGETGFVGQNGALWVAGADAINGTGSVDITVLGSVTSGNGDGIDIDTGTDVNIHIGQSGYVGTTGDRAIELTVSGMAVIRNSGTIEGTAGAISFVQTTGTSARLRIDNSGDIFGFVTGTMNAFEVYNTGTIHENIGLSGTSSTCIFQNDGVILGSVTGSSANLQFRNSGEIHGQVSFSGGSHSIINTGQILSNVIGSNTDFNFISNHGLITGIILTGTDGDTVINTGVIGGNIVTSGGDDDIDTRFGTVTGTLSGGDGNDTYRIGATGALVVETSTLVSTDTVVVTASYALTANVENLTLDGAADIDGTGNDLANVMIGSAGANRIWGKGGNDSLGGGDGDDLLRGGNGDDSFVTETAGDDTLHGGNGFDAVRYGNITGDIVVDLGPGTATGDSIDTDTLTSIERVQTGLGNDRISGTKVAEWLEGNAGNDRLSASGGIDTLDGGAGVDTLTGGAQADVFLFAAEADIGLTAGARDIIADFDAGAEIISLAAIDAATGGANDAFSFVGTASLAGGAGRLRFEQFAAQNLTVIEGDVNGDAAADFRIELTGLHVLTVANFDL